jgi:hypothetical protein
MWKFARPSLGGRRRADGPRAQGNRLSAAVLVALVGLLVANACGTDAPIGPTLPSGSADAAIAAANQVTAGAMAQDRATRLRATQVQTAQRNASPAYDFVAEAADQAVGHNSAHGLDARLAAEGMRIAPDDPECL